MSYSVTMQVRDGMPIKDTAVLSGVRSAQEISQLENPLEQMTPSEIAAYAGLNVVHQMLLSGLVGSLDKEYSVVITGHANPGFEPAEGWANDNINISITQL